MFIIITEIVHLVITIATFVHLRLDLIAVTTHCVVALLNLPYQQVAMMSRMFNFLKALN